MKKLLNYLSISDIERISFRNDINGLRAIAVLAVVFYHGDLEIFNGGWLGVDIFFVISGYLISNIIISELNNGTFTFRNFYLRRVRRIIPALFSTLLLTIPFAYWLLTPKAMMEYVNSLISSIFFYANYYFQNLDFYNAAPTKVMPLLHTWSLAIEEQFYLVFPLFCFVIFKLSKKYFSVALGIIFLFSIFLNSTTSELIKFYQFQFRAWELILGSLIMILQHKFKVKHTEKIGFTLILFSIFYFDDSMLTLNSIEPRLVANLGVALILFSSSKNIVSKFLSNSFFSFIGIISYSIYLFHQPLFAFIILIQKRYPFFTGPNIFLLTVVFLILASYLNWKFVENKLQHISTKILFSTLVIFLVIFILFIFLSYSNNGFVNRYDYIPEEVLYYSMNPNIYPEMYPDKDYKFKNSDCNNQLSKVNYCIWFNEVSDKTIYLVGDSHTNALSVSFLVELESLRKEYNLVFLTNKVGRCLLSKQSDTVGEVKECSDEFFQEFINILNKDKDIVVAFGRYNTWLTPNKGQSEIKCTDCDYVQSFKSRLEEIAKKSSKFYIIEPIPVYSFSISDSYLYKNTTWGDPITSDLSDWESQIRDTNNFLNNLKSETIQLVPTIPIFCDVSKTKKCFAAYDDKLFYSDSNHLTLTGANLITNTIEIEILNQINK